MKFEVEGEAKCYARRNKKMRKKIWMSEFNELKAYHG